MDYIWGDACLPAKRQEKSGRGRPEFRATSRLLHVIVGSKSNRVVGACAAVLVHLGGTFVLLFVVCFLFVFCCLFVFCWHFW
jgi:hypothetical protein